MTIIEGSIGSMEDDVASVIDAVFENNSETIEELQKSFLTGPSCKSWILFMYVDYVVRIILNYMMQ